MTENKPIMIDGVDVSGCKYFKTNYKEDCDVKIDNCCCDTYVPCCSEFKYNCYFKQLARKTQECEQAEQKLEKIKDRCNKTLEIMNEFSDTNAYASGRCIEAENILQIIDEVE